MQRYHGNGLIHAPRQGVPETPVAAVHRWEMKEALKEEVPDQSIKAEQMRWQHLLLNFVQRFKVTVSAVTELAVETTESV